MKGPGLCIGQFITDTPPFDDLYTLAEWAAGVGFTGLQVPPRVGGKFILEQAAASKDYCHELKGELANRGVEITEISAHMAGQLLAVHPAYDIVFDGFAPPEVRGNSGARQAWAREQLSLIAKASENLGLTIVPGFTGALVWPYMYPWPQRPPGQVEEAFEELGRLWKPVFDEYDEHGLDLAFELHPGEDAHDGASFERFLDAVDGHPRCNINYDPSHFVLQALDYAEFIRIYADRIKGFHVKDAELQSDGRVGVYGGYLGWSERAGRFRSLGDGQVDFKRVFSLMAEIGYEGWAVLEWECAIKSSDQGAREGAQFIKDHIIEVTDRAFDDFAAVETDKATNRRILGL